MQFERGDIPFLVIFLSAFILLLYNDYEYKNKIEKDLKDIKDFNYSLLIRQVDIQEQHHKISIGIDSLRFLYLHK